MAGLFFTTSIVTLPLIVNLPLPVLYNSIMSPKTRPPVGKSGAFTISLSSSIVVLGFFISATIASQTSVKLCGGIFVAIPTAIPVAPFKIKAGSFPGNSFGSFKELSKFG